MTEKTQRLSAKQTEDLARSMNSTLLFKAADAQYHKEQALMEHKIGALTMKVVAGVYYQLRPQGWVRVDSMSDIIFNDVREVPINERIRCCRSCRIESEAGTERVNVSFPVRSDLSQTIIEERLARQLVHHYDLLDAEVYVSRGNSVIQYSVHRGETIQGLATDQSISHVGGATIIDLEI